MKKSYLVPLVIIGVGIIAAGSANAQQAEATTAASASAAIIADITLTKTADMNFGDVIAGAGTVVLTAAASPSRSVTGDTELGNSTSISSATFTVGGEESSTYSITLPSEDVTISSGENDMTVNTFTSDPSGTGVLTSGSQTLYVGATLNVAADQASSANYTGSFDVTVAYN